MDAIPPEVFLESYPPPIREVADRLRRLVARAVPDAIEGVRLGWRLIGYSVPSGNRTRFFAGIGPEPRHCHLFFEYGAFMPDPDRILEGADLGLKRVRYVTFTSTDGIDSIDDRVILRYVEEAVRLATISNEQRLSLALTHEPA